MSYDVNYFLIFLFFFLSCLLFLIISVDWFFSLLSHFLILNIIIYITIFGILEMVRQRKIHQGRMMVRTCSYFDVWYCENKLCIRVCIFLIWMLWYQLWHLLWYFLYFSISFDSIIITILNVYIIIKLEVIVRIKYHFYTFVNIA